MGSVIFQEMAGARGGHPILFFLSQQNFFQEKPSGQRWVEGKENYADLFLFNLRSIPSFSSKRGHVTDKHVVIGCKHDMFGNQTFEV